MVTIEVAQGEDFAKVDAFYKMVGYGGGVSEADLTLVARMRDALVGAVRLCEEGGVIVLRGMQIHPGHQRQGIGRGLLDHCIPYLNRAQAYCLPYQHLVSFYSQAGFKVAQPNELPPFLAQRLAKYLSSGQQVLGMRRASPIPGISFFFQSPAHQCHF